MPQQGTSQYHKPHSFNPDMYVHTAQALYMKILISHDS